MDIAKKYMNPNFKIQKSNAKHSNKFDTLDEETRLNILQNYNIAAFDPGVSDTIVQGVKYSKVVSNPNENVGKSNKRIIDPNYYSQPDDAMANVNAMQSKKELTFFRLTKNDYYNNTLINSGKINMKFYKRNYHNQTTINNIDNMPKNKITSIAELKSYTR